VRATSTLLAEETLLSIARTTQKVFHHEVGSADVVLSVVTAAETYVDRVLDAYVADSKLQETELGTAVIEELGDSFHKNWASRYRWLRKAFGISISGTTEQQRFDALVELRNSLVHGGGNLTRRQSVDIAKRISLERSLRQDLGVAITNRGMVLGVTTSDRAITIGRNFVVTFDVQMTSAPSSVRTATGKR
jgi:hypothetical protein